MRGLLRLSCELKKTGKTALTEKLGIGDVDFSKAGVKSGKEKDQEGVEDVINSFSVLSFKNAKSGSGAKLLAAAVLDRREYHRSRGVLFDMCLVEFAFYRSCKRSVHRIAVLSILRYSEDSKGNRSADSCETWCQSCIAPDEVQDDPTHSVLPIIWPFLRAEL